MSEPEHVEVLRPARSVPPSRIIQRELAAREWTLAQVARAGGVGVIALWQVVHEDVPVSQEVAEGLAKAFGTSVELWLNLEAEYRAGKG